MKLPALGLVLLFALGIAACGGCDDDDHDRTAAQRVIYDGPPTSVEVERIRLNSHLTNGYNEVVRVEIHGDFVKLVQKDGRIRLWRDVVQVNVRPHQLGPAPTPK